MIIITLINKRIHYVNAHCKLNAKNIYLFIYKNNFLKTIIHIYRIVFYRFCQIRNKVYQSITILKMITYFR